MRTYARMLLTAMCAWSLPVAAEFDLVLAGGRVMDPETGLDAIRNVAIVGDRIVAITAEDIAGSRVIDVSGLVVAPGFIDLHAHGQTNAANAYQVRDGVTTALELESGMPDIGRWLSARAGNAPINYGASAAHMSARALAKDKYASRMPEFRRLAEQYGAASAEAAAFLRSQIRSSVYDSLDANEIAKMKELLQTELEAGALGIGLPVGYQPAATREEIFELFRFAGARQAPIFVHVRDPGIPGIQEVIANAATTGAPLHIVHINSMALGSIELGIDLVEAAQARGLDITTEMYPYTAGSTSLESALFDDGWQQTMDITFEDIQWQDTGERLTQRSFEKYRRQGGIVIIHMMKDAWIDAGISRASTMIGSDGMPYAPGAHPRSAGTFARVLGRYVREREALSLMDALRKMTLMPAQRLEIIAPNARNKGRIKVGADADITVFDPNTVIDTATFESGLAFSEGIEHVIVNGVLVVDGGASVGDVFPGRPLYGRYRSPQPSGHVQTTIHISADDIRQTIERAPAERVSDQQIRHVEAADGNLGVGVVQRPPMPARNPVRGIRHHDQSEVYRVVSGSGTLVTGPAMIEATPLDPDGSTVRTLTGPSDFGIIDEIATTQTIGAGDVVIIPAGIAHGFSEITETITYLVIRIDPNRRVELK